MLTRTPFFAFYIAGLISIIVGLAFEIPGRSFTTGQSVLIYFLAYMPGLGIAMYFDPIVRETTSRLSKINFYEEKK
jgi:uncharacterized membrane protein